MRPLCGIQHGGNRKSQGALARSRSGRVCRRQRTARLCEFPGISPPKSPKNPITPIETSRDTLHPGTGGTTRTNRPAERVRGLGYGVRTRYITTFSGAKTLVENEKGWFDHPFFSLPNPTHGCNASMSCNGNPTGSCNASIGCN